MYENYFIKSHFEFLIVTVKMTSFTVVTLVATDSTDNCDSNDNCDDNVSNDNC